MSFVTRSELTGIPVQPPDGALAYGPAPFERRSEGLTIDFSSIWQALWRRRNWIFWPLVLGALLGVLFALTIKPRYTSVVQILVDPRDVQVVKPDTPLRAPSPDGSQTLAENAMIMLRSANVQMQVVDRHKLYDDPEFVGEPGLISRLMGRTVIEDSLDVRRLRAMNALDRRLGTKRSDKSSVVEASVWTVDAAKSSLLANSLATVFLEQQSAAESETTRRAAQAAAARLTELGARVEKAERDVEEYRARNSLQGSAGRLVSEQQMQEMNSQLVLARAKAAEAKAKYDAARKLTVQGVESGSIPEAVNSQLISQLRLKYAEAVRLETDARQKYGDRHPEMISLAAQVRDMRAQVTGELARITRAAQTEAERAKAGEEAIQRELDQARAATSDTSEASVRLRELERQAEASRSIYAAFLKRTRELSEQEDINPIAARIISPANPAQYSTALSKSLAAVGGTIAGAMLGLFLALLAEQFDGTLRHRRQFQEISGLPVLAEFSTKEQRRRLGDPLRAPVIDAPASPQALGAIRVADAFAARADGKRARSVLFVALGPFSATELVLNVSVAAAQASWRVLMVDADSDGDGVSRHLEITPDAGLGDVLSGEARLSSAVLSDDRTNVRILPRTAAASRGFRPSTGQIESRILAPASGFELIFIDGGQWGRDGTTYAFAGAVDDIVLVAQSGRVSSREVKDALDSFQPFADRLAGIVTV
jgi:uncharacterized protein involved in exopolysaccharide biosynthesis/Mrp family chromosome partitioning ATPase